MISLLVSVLLILVLLYVAKIVIAELGFSEAISKVLYLIVALIALFYFLDTAGLYHFALR